MKKIGMFVFSAVILAGFSLNSFAAAPGTPEYEKMKEYKKAQHAKKEQERAAEKANPTEKPKGFWQREAERSGFAGTGAMFGNAISGAIPLDKPNSRKTEK